MCFNRPGVAVAIYVFLASDGVTPGEHQQATVTLYLIDVSGSNHSLGELRIISLTPLAAIPVGSGVSLVLTSENVCGIVYDT